jgi:hypothetical protein
VAAVAAAAVATAAVATAASLYGQGTVSYPVSILLLAR